MVLLWGYNLNFTMMKTQQDLQSVIDIIKDLHAEMVNLSIMWVDDDEEQSIEYLLHNLYPFGGSFDELTDRVREWYECAQERLDGMEF